MTIISHSRIGNWIKPQEENHYCHICSKEFKIMWIAWLKEKIKHFEIELVGGASEGSPQDLRDDWPHAINWPDNMPAIIRAGSNPAIQQNARHGKPQLKEYFCD